MVQARTVSRSDARRNHDAVIAAAVRVLGESPGASMQEIADASGLGRTTVYRHFPTREDLELAIFEHAGAEASALARELIAREPTAAGVLRRLGPEIVSIGQRYSFLLACRAGREPHAPKQGDDPLRAFLARAQRRGEVRRGMSPDWMLVMLRGMATAAIEEVDAGRVSGAVAGRRLGEALVAAFAA